MSALLSEIYSSLFYTSVTVVEQTSQINHTVASFMFTKCNMHRYNQFPIFNFIVMLLKYVYLKVNSYYSDAYIYIVDKNNATIPQAFKAVIILDLIHGNKIKNRIAKFMNVRSASCKSLKYVFSLYQTR